MNLKQILLLLLTTVSTVPLANLQAKNDFSAKNQIKKEKNDIQLKMHVKRYQKNPLDPNLFNQEFILNELHRCMKESKQDNLTVLLNCYEKTLKSFEKPDTEELKASFNAVEIKVNAIVNAVKLTNKTQHDKKLTKLNAQCLSTNKQKQKNLDRV